MTHEREKQRHPSFGQIHFSRINGRASFYGSELEQDHYIIMEVKNSEVSRDLGRDWYFAYSQPLIQVRMTASQFSELITSMNQGSGVPCTIEMVDGKRIEQFPTQESRKEFTHRKFRERMEEFAKDIKENQEKARKLIAKKTLSKDDQHELNMNINWLTTEITNNIPFFMECFQETADEVVLEAKREVENAIQHKISMLGLQKLQEQNKLLE